VARSAYLDALHLLGRRALTEAECRARLADRQHPADEIDAAIAHLRESGGLDDRRLAESYVRSASDIKGRGRLRIVRELVARGVDKTIAAEATGEFFGEKDERALVSQAVKKRLRGKPQALVPADYARLYQYLMRQGFTPAVVVAVLRGMRRPGGAAWQDDELQ
jgi:regulatory protein